MEQITTDETVKLGFVLAGGCGVNIARWFVDTIPVAAHPHLYVTAINTDKAQLKAHLEREGDERLQAWLDKKQLNILKIGKGLHGAGGVPEVGRAAMEENVESLREILRGLNTVICIAGGGGGTGTGALPVIAREAVELGIPTLSILTMPMLMEQNVKLARAMEMRRKLVQICPTAVIFNQNHPDKRASFGKMWQAINMACLSPIILSLRVMIQEVGSAINHDPADWGRLMAAGNFAAFGHWEMPYTRTWTESPMEIDEIAKALLENPYQDPAIIPEARKLDLLLGGEWAFGDAEELVAKITDRIRAVEPNADIEIKIGIFENSGDERRWAFLVAVAQRSLEQEETRIEKAKKVEPKIVRTLDLKLRTATITGAYVAGKPQPPLQVTPATATIFNAFYTKNLAPADAKREFAGIIEMVASETGVVVDEPLSMATAK